jgi:hypothetical protein
MYIFVNTTGFLYNARMKDNKNILPIVDSLNEKSPTQRDFEALIVRYQLGQEEIRVEEPFGNSQDSIRQVIYAQPGGKIPDIGVEIVNGATKITYKVGFYEEIREKGKIVIAESLLTKNGSDKGGSVISRMFRPKGDNFDEIGIGIIICQAVSKSFEKPVLHTAEVDTVVNKKKVRKLKENDYMQRPDYPQVFEKIFCRKE